MTDANVLLLAEKVAKLERTVAFLLEKLDMTYTDDPSKSTSVGVLNLVKQGNMMAAIQLYRQESGVCLAEAKQFVESLAK